VPSWALQAVSTHEAQAGLEWLKACWTQEAPPLLLLKPPLPPPLLLPKPPLPLPLLHESRLKPEHWLVHAVQLPRPAVAELQADEMLDEQA
jgi:hypothetical protein